MHHLVQRIDKDSVRRHLPEFLKLESECFGELRWTQENIELDLPGKWVNSFGLTDQRAQFVAYLIAGLLTTDHIHIYRVAVLREYQGLNYGQKLLVHSLNHYLTNGIREITVEIDNRFPADEFYLKHGFHSIEGKELKSYLRLRNRIDKFEPYTQNKSRVYKYLIKI